MAHTHHTTTKRSFTHLSAIDRGRIEVLRKQGHTLQAIADEIGCHKSTISRELKRGSVLQRRSNLSEHYVYFPDRGQTVYEQNRLRCGAKMKLLRVCAFINYAIKQIRREGWSPDAVCGYAKAQNRFHQASVCTKTLYHYIDLGLLPIRNIDLPVKVSRNTKKPRLRQHKRKLGASIEERPTEIETRGTFGHWEIDTVIGTKNKGAVLLTLTERKTRFEHIVKLNEKTATCVEQALKELKQHYGAKFTKVFKTITADNGPEFSRLSQVVESDQHVYFAHPYTSCERGTNERHNGLIRRFIPKGKSMDFIDPDLIATVEHWCNMLPRKILKYDSPSVVYHTELATLT
jgi:IS30 family transposase